MNQTEINILNLENRILKDRGELNDLIFQYRQNKNIDALMDQKLREMQREVAYLNEQLTLLKESRIESVVQKPQYESDIVQPVMSEKVQTVSGVLKMASSQEPMKLQANVQAAPSAKKQKDMESIIGKSWMGAIASILIFISIIMFATLILPTLTDTVKMIVMYAASSLVTVFGLIRLRKDEKSPFNLAVSGCGIGAIYISLILTNLYFKAIGDVLLYLLIAVWAIFVCVLSRLKSTLFQVIGQCGILIAVFFGCGLCCENHDSIKFVVLVFFYLITSLVFMWVHYSKDLSGNLISLIFNHINAWILLLASHAFLEDKKVYMVAGLMMVYIVAAIVVCFKVNLDKAITSSTLIIMNLFVFAQYLRICLQNEFGLGVVQLVVGVLLIVLAEWKFKEKIIGDKRVLQFFAILMLFFAVIGMNIWAQEILLIIISAALLVHGYDCKDKIYHYSSVIIVAIVIYMMDMTALHCAVTVAYFALFLTLSLWKKEQYQCALKLVGYFVSAFFVWKMSELMNKLPLAEEANIVLHLLVMALVNIVAMKTIGTKNFLTGKQEKVSEALFSVYNARMMVVSIWHVGSIEHVAWHLLTVLIAGMVFMVNSGNLLKRYQGKKEEMYAGIYVGLKLTILVWVSLASFDTANLIVSIVCFVLAIVGIMIGFGLQFKSLRIYGLVLSLFSVVKLIMVDMVYDNLTGRAAGFFVCGILCFVISLIYNTIDKKMKKS